MCYVNLCMEVIYVPFISPTLLPHDLGHSCSGATHRSRLAPAASRDSQRRNQGARRLANSAQCDAGPCPPTCSLAPDDWRGRFHWPCKGCLQLSSESRDQARFQIELARGIWGTNDTQGRGREGVSLHRQSG